MTSPVDLTDLRSMTDGNKELELALFEEFYSSTEACLAILEAQCSDGQNETWRSNAHALKGTAYNLGAMALGDLCKKAQDEPAASGSDKRALLTRIQAEYAQVKTYLQTVHA